MTIITRNTDRTAFEAGLNELVSENMQRSIYAPTNIDYYIERQKENGDFISDESRVLRNNGRPIWSIVCSSQLHQNLGRILSLGETDAVIVEAENLTNADKKIIRKELEKIGNCAKVSLCDCIGRKTLSFSLEELLRNYLFTYSYQ